MGYWEQIGVANRRWEAERAKLPRWRRFDWTSLFAWVFALLFWGVLIYGFARAFWPTR